jgi:hypothetical protein
MVPRPHYSENPSAFPLEGGCGCGQVRYRLERAPLVVHCCHCTLCQREGGSAFCINAVVEGEHVKALPPARATVPPSAVRVAEEPLPCGPPLPPAEGHEAVSLDLIRTPSESGFGHTIARCPTCRIAVWSNYAGAGPVFKFVKVGTLDRPWEIAPDVHSNYPPYAESPRRHTE